MKTFLLLLLLTQTGAHKQSIHITREKQIDEELQVLAGEKWDQKEKHEKKDLLHREKLAIETHRMLKALGRTIFGEREEKRGRRRAQSESRMEKLHKVKADLKMKRKMRQRQRRLGGKKKSVE